MIFDDEISYYLPLCIVLCTCIYPSILYIYPFVNPSVELALRRDERLISLLADFEGRQTDDAVFLEKIHDAIGECGLFPPVFFLFFLVCSLAWLCIWRV
jgi:hypothetical protein